MAKTKDFKFKRTVQAAPEQVFRAFTTSTGLREWLCDHAHVEARKGGRLFVAWNNGYYAHGRFTKLDPGRKVNFTWWGSDEPAATVVKVSLAEKQAGTAITLVHEGVGTGKKWGSNPEDIARGWETGLETLQALLETGEDQRFTLRPMLGVVGLTAVTPELAERRSLPVTQGVLLDGTIPGMGADAAGLRSEDVLVSMDGARLAGYHDMLPVLQAHRAGDTVPVVFYRAGEKQTTDMTLSRRPLPEIPWSPPDLADAVRRANAEVDAELAACLEGVSDDEAAHKPAPDAWSALEVLAHLIHGERDFQSWVVEVAGGFERSYDAVGANSDAYVAATAAVYPTLAGMAGAVRAAQAESAALLAALPAEFAAQKGSYWRIAYNTLAGGPHARDHLQQIAAAVGAARQARSEAP
jgi:uncharacterized protein YndB with AHSA1/START domain